VIGPTYGCAFVALIFGLIPEKKLLVGPDGAARQRSSVWWPARSYGPRMIGRHSQLPFWEVAMQLLSL
jgi:hypothetical protein